MKEDPEIIKQIQKKLKSGYPAGELENDLMDKGYPAEQVEKLFLDASGKAAGTEKKGVVKRKEMHFLGLLGICLLIAGITIMTGPPIMAENLWSLADRCGFGMFSSGILYFL